MEVGGYFFIKRNIEIYLGWGFRGREETIER